MRVTVDASVTVKWLVSSVPVTADRKLAQVVSDRVSDADVIALEDDREMARVEEAAIRLGIDRDKIDELIEAWERVAATLRSVVDEMHPVPERGLRVITHETLQLAEDSPTHLKLKKAIEALSRDERMDLLVLGRVGDDGRSCTRRRLFDFAVTSSSNIRYIAGLGMRWSEGLRRWSTGNNGGQEGDRA